MVVKASPFEELSLVSKLFCDEDSFCLLEELDAIFELEELDEISLFGELFVLELLSINELDELDELSLLDDFSDFCELELLPPEELDELLLFEEVEELSGWSGCVGPTGEVSLFTVIASSLGSPFAHQ